MTNLSGKKLAITLAIICAAAVAITVLYSLITVASTEVNPVGVVAAMSVAVAGIAWFKKASCHK